MEQSTPLEDAEALRLLLDNIYSYDRQARQVADLAGRTTHTVRRFVETALSERPDDPRHLLGELGALLELGAALERTQGGLEEALASLVFAWSPRPARCEEIQIRELASLRERLQTRSRARWRRRERGGRGAA